jgi:hypothetical protein
MVYSAPSKENNYSFDENLRNSNFSEKGVTRKEFIW